MVSMFARVARGMVAPAALVLALALGACGGAQIPPDAKTTTLSLVGADCADCGAALVARLRERPGVYAATFDKQKAEVTLAAAPTFDPLSEARTAGRGTYLPWTKPPEGADVATIAEGGADVPDLAPHLVKGKVTVIDFGALWCEPCRKLDEHMMGLLAKRPDVAYRKLDIGDWDTPLAQRYLKSAAALPFVIVYDAAGTRVTEIAGLDLAKLDMAIGKGAP
jgi:thiol-disulfide isomerase/thioredoxin